MGPFMNTRGESFTLEGVFENMEAFVAEDLEREYALIIGTDSQHHHDHTVFVTAIIIHRVGQSARFYYTRRVTHDNLDLTTRILTETSDSVLLVQELEKSGVYQYLGREAVEVHIDAGTRGKSQKVLEACINFVKGMGYQYKVKPDSFGATHVADRYTK